MSCFSVDLNHSFDFYFKPLLFLLWDKEWLSSCYFKNFPPIYYYFYTRGQRIKDIVKESLLHISWIGGLAFGVRGEKKKSGFSFPLHSKANKNHQWPYIFRGPFALCATMLVCYCYYFCRSLFIWTSYISTHSRWFFCKLFKRLTLVSTN